MARKGENIYQRKDGRWEARFMIGRDADQKARYKSVYAHSYLKVKEKRQKAIKELKEKPFPGQPKAGTVETVSRAWLQENAKTWKESTFARYQEKVENYILPEFGKRELSDISTDEVDNFLKKISSTGLPGRKPVGHATVSMILTVMSQIRLHALRNDCQVRFSTGCIKVKRRSHGKITVFSECDEKKLITYLKKNTDETAACILTCLFTGMRIGEICALNCDEIDLENRVIHVVRTMQRLPDSKGEGKTTVKIDTPKSEHSIRDIPISKELSEILWHFHKPGAFLLTGDKKLYIEPRTLENRFASILKKCDLKKVKYHTTRHTFATRCIERGMDPKTLAEILGHASVATTMDYYVHLSMQHKADSMELLSDLFSV